MPIDNVGHGIVVALSNCPWRSARHGVRGFFLHGSYILNSGINCALGINVSVGGHWMAYTLFIHFQFIHFRS